MTWKHPVVQNNFKESYFAFPLNCTGLEIASEIPVQKALKRFTFPAGYKSPGISNLSFSSKDLWCLRRWKKYTVGDPNISPGSLQSYFWKHTFEYWIICLKRYLGRYWPSINNGYFLMVGSNFSYCPLLFLVILLKTELVKSNKDIFPKGKKPKESTTKIFCINSFYPTEVLKLPVLE